MLVRGHIKIIRKKKEKERERESKKNGDMTPHFPWRVRMHNTNAY